jgi:hypothetical protein
VFSVTDLFIVGTALDLVGGYLVARGLVVSLPVVYVRSRSLLGGNSTVATGAVEDRVDATFGLLTLGLGFTLQASGYFLVLDGQRASHSLDRALIGLALAVAVGTLAVLIWRRLRESLIRANLIQLARYGSADGQVEPGGLPDELWLAGYGRAWKGGQAGESDAATVARIFGDIKTRPHE